MEMVVDGQILLDLCRKLGYDPGDVSDVVITPEVVTVKRYLNDANGKKVGAVETIERPIRWPSEQ